MPFMPPDAWDRLDAAHQDHMASLGVVPESEPWMDEAYERLTGASSRGVIGADTGKEPLCGDHS